MKSHTQAHRRRPVHPAIRAARRPPRPDELLWDIAEAQAGIITRQQALTVVGASAIARRLKRDWRPVLPSTYRWRGFPDSIDQRAWAVALWSDGVVSHRAAAELWTLETIASTVDVTAHRRRSRPGFVVHESERLSGRDRTTHPRTGVPITSVPRTIIDLAAVVSPTELEIAVDAALRQGLTTVRRVAQRLDELDGSGRAGCVALREILAVRGSGRGGDSAFETLVFAWLRHHQIPLPDRQVAIRGVGRVDFAWTEARLILEAQSWRWHGSRSRWEADIRRRRVAQAVGYDTLELVRSDLTDQRAAELLELLQWRLARGA